MLDAESDQKVIQLRIVLQIDVVPALADLVERGLGDAQIAALDDARKLAVQERQQQGTDVRSVHVRVRHDDDLVITQLGQVVVVFPADAGSQGRQEQADFLRRQHLVEAGLLDVQNLAAQRENRLRAAVAALLGRAARGVALDQEQLALLGVALLAVGQFARQRAGVERALAPREFAGLAGGLAGARRFDALLGDLLGLDRMLFEITAQLVVQEGFDEPLDFAVAEFGLGLALELRFRHLDADDRGQPFPNVLALQALLVLFEQAERSDISVDRTRQRGSQPDQVRPALDGIDVVGERIHVLGIALVPLQGDVDRRAVLLAAQIYDFVQRRLGASEVFDERRDSAFVEEVMAFIGFALVYDRDVEARIQKGEFAQPPRQDIEAELLIAEDLLIRQEDDPGAALFGRPDGFQGGLGRAAAIPLDVYLPGTFDLQFQEFGQGVDDGHADAVQPAGNPVGAVVELSAGVQLGQHDLGRGHAFGRMLFGGDTAAVIDDGDAAVGVDRDDDLRAVAGQGLIDRVVDEFENEVVQAPLARIADVHARPLAHGLQTFEDLDLIDPVGLFDFLHGHAKGGRCRVWNIAACAFRSWLGILALEKGSVNRRGGLRSAVVSLGTLSRRRRGSDARACLGLDPG